MKFETVKMFGITEMYRGIVRFCMHENKRIRKRAIQDMRLLIKFNRHKNEMTKLCCYLF